MGGDSLHDLPGWREPARILELATLIVVRRPHSPPPDFSILDPLLPPEQRFEFRSQQRDLVVDMPQIDLSSNLLRDAWPQARAYVFRTPRAVEKYIETHGLYRK